MTKTLEASKTLAGICSAGSAVTYTISGDEIASSVDTWKMLAQGVLGTSAATIYTPVNPTVVKEIVLVNTTASPVTVKLFEGGTAAANQILPLMVIPANGMLTINDSGCQVIDGAGATSAAVFTFTGDVTGSGSGTIALTIAAGAVGNSKLAPMAQATFKMRAAGAGTGDPIDGSAAQAKTALAIVPGDVGGFDTQVRSSRLDQMAVPTGPVNINSQLLSSVATPVSGTDAANKTYVDSVAAGVLARHVANVAKDSNQASLTGLPTIDTVTLTDSQVALLTAQTTASQNGLWLVHSGAWTRPTYYATGSDATGSYVNIEQGGTYAGSEWILLGAGPITVDTTAQVWQETTGTFDITVDSTIVKTGNQLKRAPITGDGAIADGSNTLTLATVNSNVGTFGDATHTAAVTVNGKGLLTAASSVAITGLAESAITNLVTDLAAKAPLASPTFTGTPAGPTAAQGTNTTQLATTAMVHSEVVLLASLIKGTAVKTAAYAAAVWDFVPVDTTSAAFATTLPTAPADGSAVIVKWVAGPVTNLPTVITGGSDVFNITGGVTTATFAALNQVLTFRYKATGAIWYVETSFSKGGLDTLYKPIPVAISTASSATPTIAVGTTGADIYVNITALAAAITSMTTNLSGTPTNFQHMIVRIKDNGTARAITWGASYEACGVALPTSTIISKRLTVGLIYDTGTSKWGCVSVAQET